MSIPRVITLLVFAAAVLPSARSENINVAYGSYFQVKPDDLVGYSGGAIQNPKASAVYFSPTTLKDVPIRTVKATSDGGGAVVVWPATIPLLNSSVFKSGMTSDVLAYHPIYPVFAYMQLNCKDAAGKTSSYSLRQALVAVAPSIHKLYSEDGATVVSYSRPGTRIVIKGAFFGSKSPKVWIEYPDGKAVKRLSCRVLKQGMVYLDYAGKPSAMDCDAGSPTYGESRIMIQLPVRWPSGWDENDLRDLVVDNGAARGCIPFGAETPKSPDNYAVPVSFAYQMDQTVSSEPRITLATGEPLSGIRVEAYDNDPQVGGNMVAAFTTDADGRIPLELILPMCLQRVFLQLNYVGLADSLWMDLDTGKLSIAPLTPKIETGFQSASPVGEQADASLRQAAALNKYKFLGTYNASGVPSYLTSPGDTITSAFLADINASVPESKPVPLYHPDYLDSMLELNTVIREDADVWVTFVHEGAGYCNLLGFYTYQKNSPPASLADIPSFTIIFPNVSYDGSGGGLHSGDKVFIGRFTAGTVIGYFLIPNGWYANKNSYGQYTAYYSNSAFNPESDPALKQHVILLWDSKRSRVMLSFEDLNRSTSGCDNDFNDAVFYVSSSPATAIETSRVAAMDTPQDRDGDGVSDLFDDYPDDPTRAFENYYPAKNAFGTIAYEDMWPKLGDYDFNDLVLRYSFRYATNTKAQMVDVRASLVVSAAGASKSNGFGFSMPFAPALVKSVSGQRLGRGYINLNANGTEAAQSKAVVIVNDNVFDVIAKPSKYYINTQKDAPYVEPVTLDISIALTSPQLVSTFGPSTFNHFLIVDQTRGHEVHMPGKPPTDLANTSLFHTGDDDSVPAQGRYYVSKLTLPWAMNIPYDWQYPFEAVMITKAYNRFGEWSQSGGASYANWYQSPLADAIYAKPAK